MDFLTVVELFQKHLIDLLINSLIKKLEFIFKCSRTYEPGVTNYPVDFLTQFDYEFKNIIKKAFRCRHICLFYHLKMIIMIIMIQYYFRKFSVNHHLKRNIHQNLDQEEDFVPHPRHLTDSHHHLKEACLWRKQEDNTRRKSLKNIN